MPFIVAIRESKSRPFLALCKLLTIKDAIEIFLNTYQLICALSDNAIKNYILIGLLGNIISPRPPL